MGKVSSKTCLCGSAEPPRVDFHLAEKIRSDLSPNRLLTTSSNRKPKTGCFLGQQDKTPISTVHGYTTASLEVEEPTLQEARDEIPSVESRCILGST
jgi:hypothetical protein